MRKFSILVVLLLSLSFIPGHSIAQDKPKTEISSVKLKGETVHFALTSSRPFIFGNNRYILHIGSKEFYRNEQNRKGAKNALAFLIPSAEFKALPEGSPIYLTYGNVDVEQDASILAKNHRCWSLGKFSKGLLK